MNNNKKIVTDITRVNLSLYETKRAVIYARVSSKKDAAEDSLETQEEKLKNCIEKMPNATFVKTYADNGISGTLEERPAFQEMIKACREGKIDLIVTKSITRFARNTSMTLSYLRELKSLGIDVYFHKENAHSINSDGEFIITLLAIFAEAEAESASENQLWRIKKNFELGIPSPTRVYGYEMMDKEFVVVPEEAKIIKRIFNEYSAGKGCNVIAKELNQDKIPPLRGTIWHPATVNKMLHNEIYSGDLLLQKTYRENFRTKVGKINHGEKRKYYIPDDHEKIIDKELFNAVQKIAKNRYTANSSTPPATKSKNLFTGLISCGECGNKLIHKSKHSIPYWSCKTYQFMGKNTCPTASIPESIIKEAIMNKLTTDNLTREDVVQNVKHITAYKDKVLVIDFNDGSSTSINWQPRSRKDSWTPAMKQQAREKRLLQIQEASL